jgi:hypothetical protein
MAIQNKRPAVSRAKAAEEQHDGKQGRKRPSLNVTIKGSEGLGKFKAQKSPAIGEALKSNQTNI